MDTIAISPWFQPPSCNLYVALPNFCSFEVKIMNIMSLQITPKLSTVSITQAWIEFLVNKMLLLWNQEQNSHWLQWSQSSRWWWCEVFLHFLYLYLYQSYLGSYIHDTFTYILVDSTKQCSAPSVEYLGLNLPLVTATNNVSAYILLLMPIWPWS